MKTAGKWLGLAATLLCLYFFSSQVVAYWKTIREFPGTPAFTVAFLGSMALYLSTYATSGKSWQLALRMASTHISLGKSTRIIMQSQIAKFAPGNVAHHIGRVVLANRAGIPPATTVATAAIDMLALLIAALLAALLVLEPLTTLIRQYEEHLEQSARLATITGLTLSAVALFAYAGSRRVRRGLRKFAGVSGLSALGNIQNLRRMLACIALYLGSFVLGGSALWLIAESLPASNQIQLVWAVGTYAVAWLAGFIAPGAPAGLGVREAVIVLALGPMAGKDVATTSALFFRLATTIGDGAAFSIAWLYEKKIKSSD
ncbi:hypothetical protein CSC70_12485 [Pseudoxanthomonas kalamensis DSM 18571]|uniref:lysylphosphatidylglycerol synthase transmembrane domain-containing protein n=1 Tax=Pseudoxanthomonas kalamensis TaxID=289483 RepID=UPI0013907CFA|nr:lysylphosphatidylglycerol synthase domain-containing protein [Pseudoxanthomonas kalamensis]KAF1708905.1 hypothetical protein CSC70_12485 [Pseudoxanthomonas kalamensis DSM 18571]